MSAIKLTVINGIACTSSIDLSNKFKKHHYRVLRAIENKIVELQNVMSSHAINGVANNDFCGVNFIETFYRDAQNKPRKMYLLTRDAFDFVAFGFTGLEASKWQLEYIKEFRTAEINLRHAQSRIETLEQLEMFPDQLREREYTIAEVQTKLSNLGLFTPRTSTNAIKNAIKRDGSIGRFDGQRWVMNESGLKSYVKRREIAA
jgi:Rha family phage regulatory protein